MTHVLVDGHVLFLHRDLHDLGSLVEGQMDIPRQSLDKPIPYKYVIHRGSKDTVEYEFIYEQPQKNGEHINRCLIVKSALLGTGGKLAGLLSTSAHCGSGEQTWDIGPLLGTGLATALMLESCLWKPV